MTARDIQPVSANLQWATTNVEVSKADSDAFKSLLSDNTVLTPKPDAPTKDPVRPAATASSSNADAAKAKSDAADAAVDKSKAAKRAQAKADAKNADDASSDDAVTVQATDTNTPKVKSADGSSEKTKGAKSSQDSASDDAPEKTDKDADASAPQATDATVAQPVAVPAPTEATATVALADASAPAAAPVDPTPAPVNAAPEPVQDAATPTAANPAASTPVAPETPALTDAEAAAKAAAAAAQPVIEAEQASTAAKSETAPTTAPAQAGASPAEAVPTAVLPAQIVVTDAAAKPTRTLGDQPGTVTQQKEPVSATGTQLLSNEVVQALEEFKQSQANSNFADADTGLGGGVPLGGSVETPTSSSFGAALGVANQLSAATGQVAATTGATPRLVPVVQQVSVALYQGASKGDGTINIDIHPQNLGRVEVQLKVDKDGRVAATIVADHPETLQMLRRDLQTLQQSLQDAGLQSDSGSFTFNLRGENSNDGSGRSARNSGNGALLALQELNEPVDDTGRVLGNGMVDIRV